MLLIALIVILLLVYVGHYRPNYTTTTGGVRRVHFDVVGLVLLIVLIYLILRALHYV